MSTLKADTLTASTTNGSITIQGNGSGTVAIADNTAIDGAVTINDSGNDVDFRVESDGNANMLFVDGGNNRVGIGHGSPAYGLDVLVDNVELQGTGSDFYLRLGASGTSSFPQISVTGDDLFLRTSYGNRVKIAAAGDVTFYDNTVARLNLKDYGEVTNAIGSTGGGTQDIDLTLGNNVVATVDTSANTFTFSNPTASDELCGFTLFLTNGGSQTVNWPASVDWAGGTAPTLTTSGLDILVFITTDGGTIWHGMVASADSKSP